MNDSTDSFQGESRAKVDAYLDLVEARVFKALSSEAVQQSCSTTLLLVFATADALGKLTHPNAKAQPGDRFRHFLQFLGASYKERAEELWKLRKALVHNVLNIESYLSSSDLEGWTHLQNVGPNRLIYVNSRIASRDLRKAFDGLKVLLATDSSAAQLAADRLKWVETQPQSVSGEVVPTSPPPVEFIWAR